jgi:hypothetical protein
VRICTGSIEAIQTTPRNRDICRGARGLRLPDAKFVLESQADFSLTS